MSAIDEAREHLIDCGCEPELAQVATDAEVIAEMNAHYVGGMAQFEADAQ